MADGAPGPADGVVAADASGSVCDASQYDLTTTIGGYLDRHLVFPLLEFLQVKQIYPDEQLLQGKIELLQKTNMVDFAMDIHKTLHGTEDVPAEMRERRNEVVARLKTLQVQAAQIVQFLSNPALVKQLKTEKAYNLQFLQEQFSIGPEQIEALYHFAKFQFECGNYSAAAEYLFHYRTLCANADRSFSALWGKLAAEILMNNWEAALEDMTKLKDIIDSKNASSPLSQLQQRTWLLHWSLFIFFNHENGRNAIIDLFFQDRYLNAIQTNAHHLLRYLAAAILVNKRRRSALKDVVRVITQDAHAYGDPITRFLDCLFVRCDFEGAQQQLALCEVVLANDFFLVGLKDEFLEAARMHLFETYCRIHRCIDLQMLSEKLALDKDAAERWLVGLIRGARLNARVDCEAETVIMGVQHPSLYEQVIERTKGMRERTFAMANFLVAAGGGGAAIR